MGNMECCKSAHVSRKNEAIVTLGDSGTYIDEAALSE